MLENLPEDPSDDTTTPSPFAKATAVRKVSFEESSILPFEVSSPNPIEEVKSLGPAAKASANNLQLPPMSPNALSNISEDELEELDPDFFSEPKQSASLK